jgi:hypothetical protein
MPALYAQDVTTALEASGIPPPPMPSARSTATTPAAVPAPADASTQAVDPADAAPANVVAVTTADELRAAIESSIRDIRIVKHLDLSDLKTIQINEQQSAVFQLGVSLESLTVCLPLLLHVPAQ